MSYDTSRSRPGAKLDHVMPSKLGRQPYSLGKAYEVCGCHLLDTGTHRQWYNTPLDLVDEQMGTNSFCGKVDLVCEHHCNGDQGY